MVKILTFFLSNLFVFQNSDFFLNCEISLNYVFFKSSDVKASKCRLKCSSKMGIFLAPVFRFSNFTLMAMNRSFSMQLKQNN